MKSVTESSHREGRRRKGAFLDPKTTTRIGFWNVRTMAQSTKTAQVVGEMDRYHLDILGVSEMRWPGSDEKRTCQKKIVYSGTDNGYLKEGVGLILGKQAERCLSEWEPINSRLIRARFVSKYRKMTIIQCYAPTNDANEADKDRFYELLQHTVNKVAGHDMLIVMGDFNAKVGNDCEGVENVMGKHGVGIINDNGERLQEFCMTEGLVIGGTIFPHNTIHKTTWISPDGQTKNQIDHFCIKAQHKTSMLDVRAFRGADVASDHNLCVAKVRVKLKAQKSKTVSRRIDSQRLREERTATQFQIELKNRFQVLGEDTNLNLEESWSETKGAIVVAAKESAGFKCAKRKEWISDETWQYIKERREAKAAVLSVKTDIGKQHAKNVYKMFDNKVKSAARKDKRHFVDSLAEEAENAAKCGNTKSLYQISKQLIGNKKSRGGPIKDRNGKVLTTNEEQKTRWAEHFQEVLNRPHPDVTFDFEQEVEGDRLDIYTGPITPDEVLKAIKSMANGKAAGNDEITSEMLKAMDGDQIDYITSFFNKVWEEEKVPEDWRKGVIVKIPKKGDLSDCNNWRGVTLISVMSKVFSKVMLGRIRSAVDNSLREEQAGFRPGRSCLDQIFTLRIILEEYVEKQRSLLINFIDFKKAFDSLHRESLWKIMACYGIPPKVINIIKDMYKNNQCAVRTGEDLSEWFDIETGVKQGCILSPLLFGIAIDFVMRKCVQQQTGIPWINNRSLEDLDFADDLALLSESDHDMQVKTDKLDEMGGKVGLKISFEKTKVIRTNTDDDADNDGIQLNGKTVEEVNQFTYLGACIERSGNARVEVLTRISKAATALKSLNKIWLSKLISLKTKLKLFNSSVVSTLVYASESWKSTKEFDRKLDSFENKCLRKILGIRWDDFKTTKEIRELSGQPYVSHIIQRRRWSYVGHLCRSGDARIPKQALGWSTHGRRKRGRPRETLMRTMMREAGKMGMSNMAEVMAAAQDRDGWRLTVEALCDDVGTGRM